MKILVWMMFALLVSPAFAKRGAPKTVTPMVSDGIEYSAPTGLEGMVVAKWVKTGSEKWRRQIYGLERKSELEADVQSCFITKLQIQGRKLIIQNEREEEFELDLDTLVVKPLPRQVVGDPAELSEPRVRRFVSTGLKYEVEVSMTFFGDHRVEGTVVTQAYDEDGRKEAHFTGTVSGAKLTVGFQGEPPPVGARSEWTNQAWTLRRQGNLEKLIIVFNAYNYSANCWENTDFVFEPRYSSAWTRER